MTTAPVAPRYGDTVAWQPERPRFRPVRLFISLMVTAGALAIAAAVLPGVDTGTTGSAFAVAVVIAVLNAVLPPLLAALRLPFTVALGFILVLVLDALAL